MSQDDHIIRIAAGPAERRMVGTVEQVGEKLKMGFTDFEELRTILGIPRGQTPRGDPSIQRGDEG
jgi:hypothetical protein